MRDGRNSINQPGVHVAVLRDVEMDALDSLGPLTRRAINESPLMVLAFPILDQVLKFNERHHGEREPLDPRSPGVDNALAKSVRQCCFKLLTAEGGLERAQQGFEPLRAKPKSTRLQRQMARYK